MAVRAYRAGSSLVVERDAERERQLLVIRTPASLDETAAKGLFVSQQRGAVPTGSSLRLPRWNAIAETMDGASAALCVFAAVRGMRLRPAGQAPEDRQRLAALLGAAPADDENVVDIPLLHEPGWEPLARALFDPNGAPRANFWEEHIQVEPGEIFRVNRSVAALAAAMPVAAAMVRDVEALDMERAESALASVHRPAPAAVRWYAAAGAGAVDRRQAADAYPLFAEMIATRVPLRHAVEGREPLQAALAVETGLAPAACRRLGRIDMAMPAGAALTTTVEDEDALGVRRRRTHGVHGRITLDDVTGLLAQLDPSWAPDSNAAWDAFVCATGSAVLPLAGHLGRNPADLVKSSRGDWAGWLGTLAKAADYDDGEPLDRRRLALGVTDAIEAAHALAQDVLIPLALRSLRTDADIGAPPFTRDAGILVTAVDAALDQAVGKSKNPVGALLSFGRTWISRIPALGRATEEFRLDTSRAVATTSWPEGHWPSLLPEPFVHGGVMITALTSREELYQEGREMEHCVGGYSAMCESGQSHILSVRGPGPARSTLQLGYVREGWSTTQHRGVRNARMAEAHAAAADALLGALKDGAVVPEQEVHDFRETNREGRGEGRARATPWQMITHLREPRAGPPAPVWQEWRHIIGGPVARADDPGVLYRNRKVRDLVGVISPDGARRIAEAAERRREHRAAVPGQQGGPGP